MLWFGGAAAMTVLSTRAAGDASAEMSNVLLRQTRIVQQRLLGPAMLLTLVSGIGMVAVLRQMPLWAGWGIVVVIASPLIAATFLRRYGKELIALQNGAGPVGDARGERERVLRRRMAVFAALNLALMLSAVWAMVYKPGL